MRSRSTRYRGITFRSELEARWALFFDMLHQPWIYEPQGFEFEDESSYLPDFWLPGQRAWFETKHESFEPLDNFKASRLAVETGTNVYIAIGIPAWPHDRPSGQIWRFSPVGRVLSGYKWSVCEESGTVALSWDGDLSDWCSIHSHSEDDKGDNTARIITAVVVSRIADFRRE